MSGCCECGCGAQVASRFLRGHNQRVPVSMPVRFWSRVERDDESMCLLWTGHRDMYGYGLFWVGGRDVKAHRYAYEQARGRIPPGFACHHRCGNRACVHPLHLALLTPAEHSRHHHPRSATCSRCGGGDFYEAPDRTRRCRTCQARRWRERYAADPAFRARDNARSRERYERRRARAS